MFQKLYTPSFLAGDKAKIAQLMSGSGTNVRRVLEQEVDMGDDCPYKTVLIFTDDWRSNALEIAREYRLPLVVDDVRNFQQERGLGRKLSLTTEGHRWAREDYTERLRKTLENFGTTGFVVFGGFEPLTNITGRYVCLNVHPGDLTHIEDGKRVLVGLHAVPIQAALDRDMGYVRSSVIQAMPYTGRGENMDDGPILGLGPKLLYEGVRDPKVIQNALKEVSDWKILPAVVLATANGEIEVDHETGEVRKSVIMDSEVRISEL